MIRHIEGTRFSKRLELDRMTGAVIGLADRLGVDFPHVRTAQACATPFGKLNARPGASAPQ